MAAEAGSQVASLVRTIRASKGLTQEGLARELGVSFATVNGWENGRHHPIPALERKLVELAGNRHVTEATGELRSTPVDSHAVTVTAPTEASRGDALATQSGWPFNGRESRDI